MPSLHMPRRAAQAFTLVELVIAVLIIGIVTASAAPRVAGAIRTSRLDAACRRIKADLAWARQSAMTKSAAHTVTFTPGSASYTLVGLADMNRASVADSVVLLTAHPYSCTLTSATFGADSTIIFDRYGRPDTGGTVVVTSGGVSKTVTVDASTGIATSS